MALIKCPECGKEISDKAHTCVHCGYPLIEVIASGDVRIKMPNNIVDGVVGFFSSKRAAVKDQCGQIRWEGNHGENARFRIEEPTKIRIALGEFADDTIGVVYPGRKYALVQDVGIHMWAVFHLAEVDEIDSV